MIKQVGGAPYGKCSKNFIFTRRAKNDVIGIGDYIAYTLREPETAYHFATGLRSAISTLQELPNRFALVDDWVLSSQGIHCMPYKNYYVFYEIEETINTVVVLRVGYNRRNWKEILLKK